MRITRETLLKLARETAQTRAQRNRRLVCIYLTGSLLEDEPLLGGTADIDLVFVHDSEPLEPREITRVSDDIHLDIAHYSQAVFHQPRHLRVDPWIGPFLCKGPVVLHDSHHWFEFTQAAVCAQFHQPELALARSATFLNEARRLWLDLQMGTASASETAPLRAYLNALERAANAVASFSGPPLTERRLLLNLPARAEAVERPGLAAGLVDLVDGGETLPAADGQAWLQGWQATLDAAAAPSVSAMLPAPSSAPQVPPRLQAPRRAYYTKAAAALWETQPSSALWILLRTWTLALDTLGPDAPGLPTWREATAALGLTGADFATRLEGLDAYLDSVEELHEAWAAEYGIETQI